MGALTRAGGLLLVEGLSSGRRELPRAETSTYLFRAPKRWGLGSFASWKVLTSRIARPQWLIGPPIRQYIMRFSIGLVDR
jgi:hypothetical protein